jgi:hypothetical protein
MATPPQLSDDLRQKATRLMAEVAAEIGTKADPAVMKSFVTPPSITALVGITLLLLMIGVVFVQMGSYYDIRANWNHYRCQPSIAPFAKLYGHDPTENMNFCIGQAVKTHSAGVIDPIYSGINAITGKVDTVVSKVEATGKGVEGLLEQFGKFVANFVNSFRLIGVRIQMMVNMVFEIFKRIFGIFMAFFYAGISAITFGENLICNPLVTFVAGIAGVDICCFAPTTRVRMADGSTRAIVDIAIGDRLADDGVVNSLLTFAGVPNMWSVRGVVVSGNHYLRDLTDSRWIRADAHPDATPAPPCNRIYCLGTSTNRIPVAVPNSNDTLRFTDYEESSDPGVTAAAQHAVEVALTGRAGPTVPDYSLGIHPDMRICLYDGSWIPLRSVQIGDRLAGDSRVAGIIWETCESVCRTPLGSVVSAAQLVEINGSWVRAGNLWPVEERDEKNVFIQILTTNNQPFLVCGGDAADIWPVRDYAEWLGPEAEEPYLAALGEDRSETVRHY